MRRGSRADEFCILFANYSPKCQLGILDMAIHASAKLSGATQFLSFDKSLSPLVPRGEKRECSLGRGDPGRRSFLAGPGLFSGHPCGILVWVGKWVDGQCRHSRQFFAPSAITEFCWFIVGNVILLNRVHYPRLFGLRRHQSISSSPVRLGYDRGTHSWNSSKWGEKRCHNSSRVVPNGGPSRSGIR